jgi:hypothetical protein
MKRQFQFCCPNCKALFPVEARLGKFACHCCGQTFTMMDLGKRGRGWTSDQVRLPGPAVSQVIHPLKKLPRWRPGDQMVPSPVVPRMGAARLRRQRRKAMRRPVSLLFGIMLLVLAGLAVISPGAVQGRTNLPDEPDPTSLNTGAAARPPSAETPTPTSSPAPTLTLTPTPSPSSTATSLTESQVIATVWQATVDQAASFSHATQTQVVEKLSATQTSLPPTLTVMAQDRDAIAAEKAFSATATAQARLKTRP